MKLLYFLSLFLLAITSVRAQDTYSIVAVDPVTGEVGSAGASCISATNLELFFPDFDPDFLGDLLPGLGAINTQSFYLEANQDLAHNQLASGSTPQEVIDFLSVFDAENNPEVRQYGVAAIINGEAQAAALTGEDCFDYKGQRVGPNYAIQGNILLGPEILDSMEARFINTEGCLAEKLMAAMQGAKVPGADTRCLSNGTSALFAFIKVAQPGDDPENPFLRLFVSYDPEGIEPIDSLQALFDASVVCLPPSSVGQANRPDAFEVFPNPNTGECRVEWPDAATARRLDIFNARGERVWHSQAYTSGQPVRLSQPGVYFVRVGQDIRKMVVLAP